MNDSGKQKMVFGVKKIFWGLVVVFFLTLFVAVLAVNFPGSWKKTNPANACINNMYAIAGAANSFALEHQLTNGAPIHFPDDLTNYLKLNSERKIFPCPEGGTYHISKVGEVPTCSLGTTVSPAHVLP